MWDLIIKIAIVIGIITMGSMLIYEVVRIIKEQPKTEWSCEKTRDEYNRCIKSDCIEYLKLMELKGCRLK